MRGVKEIRMPGDSALVMVAPARDGGAEILHGARTSPAVLAQARRKAAAMLQENAPGGQAEGAKDESHA